MGGGITRTNSWGNWVHWMKTGYAFTGSWMFGPYGETRPEAIFPFAAAGLVLFFALYFFKD